MSAVIRPLIVTCGADRLQAILHEPDQPAALGVVIVVGGPQYRVGSHRQFVLLARELASAGLATLRFDYRGMGDSEGDSRTFEAIGDDIRAAIDALCCSVPSVKGVALWGLCDAASAAAFYAASDSRVRALVLANPWVRSESGIARSVLKRYYVRRLTDAAFWRDLLHGRLNVGRAIGGFFATVRRSLTARGSTASPAVPPARTQGEAAGSASAAPAQADLAVRMADGLEAFKGRVLFILSGDDLTAGEFRDAVRASRRWRRLMRRSGVELREIPEADHTFSTRAWRDRVAMWTRDWLLQP